MKKQRMQADNVQQLMEIVRALQNGEEPDMDKIREKTQQMEREAEEARRKEREAKAAARREQEAREAARREQEAARRGEASPETGKKKTAPAESPSEAKPARKRTVPSWLVSGTPFAGEQEKETDAARRAAEQETEVEVPPVRPKKEKHFDPDSEDAFLRFLEEDDMEMPAQLKDIGAGILAAVTGLAGGIAAKAGSLGRKEKAGGSGSEEGGKNRKLKRSRRTGKKAASEPEAEERSEKERSEKDRFEDWDDLDERRDSEAAEEAKEAIEEKETSAKAGREALDDTEEDVSEDNEDLDRSDDEEDTDRADDTLDEPDEEEETERRPAFARTTDAEGGRRIGRLVSPNWREELKLEEKENGGSRAGDDLDGEEDDGQKAKASAAKGKAKWKKPQISFGGLPEQLLKYWPTLLILLAVILLIAAAALQNKSGNKKPEPQTEAGAQESTGPEVHAYEESGKIVLTARDTKVGIRTIYYALTDPDDYLNLPSYETYTQPLSFRNGQELRYYTVNNDGVATIPVREAVGEISTTRFEWPEPETEASPDEDTPDAAAEDGEEAASEAETGEGAEAENKTAAPAAGGTRHVTISAIGDCTLGIDPTITMSETIASDLQQYGPTYFFQNTSSIFEQDDATFANLEGPFTDSTDRVNKQFAFKGDANYTDILTEGSVEMVTLANNHTEDYGEEGVQDTIDALGAAGIGYCDNETVGYLDLNGVKTAFIGIYYSYLGEEYENATRSNIAAAKENGAELIIVAYHWGAEKVHYPDETQTALAHLAIDLGADLVVGHHPHVLQGVEEYNGKYIVYSLGNFCFGGNNYPAELDAMIFQESFDVSADGTVTDAGIKIIPIRTSSSTIGGYNNFQPIVLSGVDAENVIRSINDYSVGFGFTYTEEEQEEDTL